MEQAQPVVEQAHQWQVDVAGLTDEQRATLEEMEQVWKEPSCK